MKIGYARVSTEDQDLSIQRRILNEQECKKIFEEKISGATRVRPELDRMLEQIRKGDTIIIWKLDRLARSTRDLLEIAEKIKEAGASFKSLSEPWADTTSPAGKMILTVFSGIAEFERELIRERTSIGRKSAKEKGVRFGRPPRISKEQKEMILKLREEGRSASEIARIFKIHRASIYRV
jgi:DNA invertase Pin-like site-specific DNA recombinase